MVKTLLLNDNYQIISFIDERKAIKLVLKSKAEIISVWNGRKILFNSGFMEHPATLKMNYHIRLNPTKLSFSKRLVLRRDNYTCGYCKRYFTNVKNLTIDHVFPKSLGGKNCFTNCVTACVSCNEKKSNKTLAESGMILHIIPSMPKTYLCILPDKKQWHADWAFFI